MLHQFCNESTTNWVTRHNSSLNKTIWYALGLDSARLESESMIGHNTTLFPLHTNSSVNIYFPSKYVFHLNISMLTAIFQTCKELTLLDKIVFDLMIFIVGFLDLVVSLFADFPRSSNRQDFPSAKKAKSSDTKCCMNESVRGLNKTKRFNH